MTTPPPRAPLDSIARAWAYVQQDLNAHDRFWQMFSACMTGTRADHPGDLHSDLVALGNTAEALRRYRNLFDDAARGEEIDPNEAKRAIRECEGHRHLVGRVMAHVVFRAVVERAITTDDLPDDRIAEAAVGLARGWMELPLKLSEPSLERQVRVQEPTPEERAEWKERDERRDERRDRAAVAREREIDDLRSLADRIERMFGDGREGRTLLESLINDRPALPDLVPFSVLCEAAAQREMEWDSFKRAVMRQVGKLRERADAME